MYDGKLTDIYIFVCSGYQHRGAGGRAQTAEEDEAAHDEQD